MNTSSEKSRDVNVMILSSAPLASNSFRRDDKSFQNSYCTSAYSLQCCASDACTNQNCPTIHPWLLTDNTIPGLANFRELVEVITGDNENVPQNLCETLTQCGLVPIRAPESHVASAIEVAHHLVRALKTHMARVHEVRTELRAKLTESFGPCVSSRAQSLLRADVVQGREAVAELVLQRVCFETQVARLFAAAAPMASDADVNATPGIISALHREAFRLAPFSVTVASQTRTPTKPFPALAMRSELERAVQSGARVIIVEGATGSGKSTQLPQCKICFNVPYVLSPRTART